MRYRRLGWERRSCSHGSNPLRLWMVAATRWVAGAPHCKMCSGRLTASSPSMGGVRGRSGDLCQFGHVEKTITAQQRLELPFVRIRLESIQPPKSLQSD
jgi:hypothetical protein